jgi:hypothetical protein
MLHVVDAVVTVGITMQNFLFSVPYYHYIGHKDLFFFVLSSFYEVGCSASPGSMRFKKICCFQSLFN